ncbi:MAG TPA: metallophosphoesterase [Anaerohalosphaeraceae bacterium]|nr:metallophosphoesterase [Phycisphaerae bacterium]HOK96049.1 metallophosphoesterase [Anaerohalosphaeraceae bacterium]HOL32019.1 metallophosphoesterase [Anaerohalosphaeraceae bacterium]HOM76552.1 metallophosphoesterase [Anaerohalosphaeraceae bacterium]HPC64685.1 metallophosphoesterase [Anaerohalosphaeraceae bacterium]
MFFWLMLVWLAFGYILFSILERKYPCGLCNFFVRLSAIGLGVGWLCLIVLLSHDLLYLIFRFPLDISRWFAAGTILLLSVYAFMNARCINVETIELPAPVNLNIVQLSDIHLGSVSWRHLERLVEKSAALKPDAVVITGDLIDPQGHLPPDALLPLQRLNVPIYWISGNHERYFGLEKAAALLKQTAVIPLRNEAVKWSGIQLVGIDDSDDPAWVEHMLTRLQRQPDLFTVLLYHQPEGYNAAARAGIDLMLCGHTHNGQIWPFNWVVRSRFQYLKGLHRIGRMHLYISTGSGTWGPPMRLGSRNQITFICLRNS